MERGRDVPDGIAALRPVLFLPRAVFFCGAPARLRNLVQLRAWQPDARGRWWGDEWSEHGGEDFGGGCGVEVELGEFGGDGCDGLGVEHGVGSAACVVGCGTISRRLVGGQRGCENGEQKRVPASGLSQRPLRSDSDRCALPRIDAMWRTIGPREYHRQSWLP